jgi:hypothetical protein
LLQFDVRKRIFHGQAESQVHEIAATKPNCVSVAGEHSQIVAKMPGEVNQRSRMVCVSASATINAGREVPDLPQVWKAYVLTLPAAFTSLGLANTLSLENLSLGLRPGPTLHASHFRARSLFYDIGRPTSRSAVN